MLFKFGEVSLALCPFCKTTDETPRFLFQESLRIQSECRKILTRKTPSTDTFHAVIDIPLH